MAVIAEMPFYGYPRVWRVLRRRSESRGNAPGNRKRVYRLMEHGLLAQKYAGGEAERPHDGHITVAQSNLRWSPDSFEIACDNAERVRVAFAFDCCDWEAERPLTPGTHNIPAAVDVTTESVVVFRYAVG